MQLKWGEKLSIKGWYRGYFLLLGMVTSYFDFLTYPLVTLGFPLCVYLYLSREKWMEQSRNMVIYSMEWGIGYAGLWVMKWIAAEIFTGEKVISDGVQALLHRTDTMGGATLLSGYPGVLWDNISMYANWGFGLLAAGIVIWLVFHMLKNRKKINRKSVLNGVPLLLVALYPFVWFFFVQNHSAEHALFTCKILSVTVFAGICAMGKICDGITGQ